MPIPVPQTGRPVRRSQPTPASPSSGTQVGGSRRLGPTSAASEQEQGTQDATTNSQPPISSRRIVPPKVVTGLAGTTGVPPHSRIAGLRGPVLQRSSKNPPATEIVAEPVSPVVAREEESDDADEEEGTEAGDDGDGEDDEEEDEEEEDQPEKEEIEDDVGMDAENDIQQGVPINNNSVEKRILQMQDEEGPGSGSGGGSGQWQGGSFGGVSTDTGEETEVDPETEVETETESPAVGGASEPEKKTARFSEAPPTPSSPSKTRTTRGSGKEKRAQEEKDKAKMPPPPRRTASTATKVRDGKPRSTATAPTAASSAGALGRSTSVRRGTVSKESGTTSGKESTKPAARSTESSKTGLERKKSVSAGMSAAAAAAAAPAATSRHARTRSTATATKPSTPPVSFTSNATRTQTTGTDSEDPSAAAKKTGVSRTGVTKKVRPVSTVISSTRASGEKEQERASPPSPTHTRTRSTTITRDSAPGRKPAARSTTTPAVTSGPSATSSRRTQSEIQPASANTRPAFTTLQQDFSAPPPPASTQTSIHNNALLPDAPTLQKQTHLLQLLLLHNTAISSFHSLHADARTKLEARYNALAEKYSAISAAESKVARAANLAVLRRVLEEPPQPAAATIIPTTATTASGSIPSRLVAKPTTSSNRRKTLTGDVASHVEERIQILSEGIKRLEGLLRKSGDVAKLRSQWEAWFRSGNHDDGLPRQWQKEYASVKRKVEGAVEGLREFWSGYQKVLDVGPGGTGAGQEGTENGGATLERIVLGYLELGEDVVREFEEMRALERVLVEEGRERVRLVVRKVVASENSYGDGEGLEREIPAWM